MASIFDRLRAKASQAIQGVGNFVDRDQSMGGVQLAKGGLGNRVRQAFQPVAPKESANYFDNIPGSGIRARDFVRELPGAAHQVVRDYFVQPVPRAITSLSSTVGQAIGADDGITTPEEIAQGVPNKEVRDYLYGEEPVLSLQRQTENNAPKVASFLEDRGVSPELAQKSSTPLTFLGAGVMAGIDALPGDPTDLVKGGGRAALKEGGEQLLKEGAQQALPFVDDVVDAIKPGVSVTQDVLEQPIAGVKKFGITDKVLEPTRLLKKILPEEGFKAADDEILRPLNRLRGESASFKKSYQDRIKALGKDFKVGSKVSELTQKFGEGKVTAENLIKEVGEEQAQKVMNGAIEFRQMYDEILDTLNARRVESGLEAIPKRDDYFRHMVDLGKGGNPLNDLMTGGSGAKSASIMKAREGEETAYDAVGGMLDYLEKAGRAGFTDTVTPRIQKLAGTLKEGGDAQAGEYLDWLSDSVLGVKPDAGTFGNVVQNVASRMRGSRVVGNLGSVINQTASLPVGINDAGWGNFIKGMASKETREAAKQSAYLADAGYRQPLEFLSGMDQVTGRAGAVFTGC